MAGLSDVLARCVITPSSCWEWSGAKSKGYGTGLVNGKQVTIHVYVYAEMVGPVPEGLELDHVCKNKACCNPDHLEPVTHRQNLLRSCGPVAVNAAKVVCLNGHDLSGDNLYEYKGARQCKQCRRERNRTYRGPVGKCNAQAAN